MKVILSHCKNPDINGGYWVPMKRPRKHSTTVFSLLGASSTCRTFINKYGLGAGNWTGGQVFDGKKQIANISYNGRIWDMEGKELQG